MDGEPERRELRAVRSDEMRMFGCLESDLYTAFRALSGAAYYARRLGMDSLAEMLYNHTEDVVKAAYGEYDEETWKKYEDDCNEV